MDPDSTDAHACTVAEVEVDTETGEVTVLRFKPAPTRSAAQVNPAMVEQQIVGGAWMGMSHALYETTEPYYPDPSTRRSTSTSTSCRAGRPAGDRERHPRARPPTDPTASRASAR
jgi:xanthine dehydrogenase molybdopterin-binding subunit B